MGLLAFECIFLVRCLVALDLEHYVPASTCRPLTSRWSGYAPSHAGQ
jgi:hypothetical protein